MEEHPPEDNRWLCPMEMFRRSVLALPAWSSWLQLRYVPRSKSVKEERWDLILDY